MNALHRKPSQMPSFPMDSKFKIASQACHPLYQSAQIIL